MKTINICKDFSDSPGGRLISEGKNSGEAFRENILLPKYLEAENADCKLHIDFDGGFGFGTSFLEEAFGGLVRKLKKRGIMNRIVITSTEDETIEALVRKYISDAEEQL